MPRSMIAVLAACGLAVAVGVLGSVHGSTDADAVVAVLILVCWVAAAVSAAYVALRWVPPR